MTTTAALELVQLTKKYGAVTAVDAINLKIPAGSYCCLLGPSGCGKTTTCAWWPAMNRDRRHLVGPKNDGPAPPNEHGDDVQSYALFRIFPSSTTLPLP